MCTNKIEESTDQFINSESTMCAAKVFQDILFKIQSSSLNYHLQVSPFSAVISLKRTFATDKTGAVQPFASCLHKTSDINEQTLIAKQKRQIIDLENELTNLKFEHEASLNKIQLLENEIMVKKEREVAVCDETDSKVQQKEETIFLLKNSNSKLTEANTKLEKNLVQQEEKMSMLTISNQKGQELVKKLNKELNSLKLKHENEKKMNDRDHQLEIKHWKKQLGDAKSDKVKLEKEIKRIEATSLKNVSGASSIMPDLSPGIKISTKPTEPVNFDPCESFSENDGEHVTKALDQDKIKGDEEPFTQEELEDFRNEIMSNFEKKLASTFPP